MTAMVPFFLCSAIGHSQQVDKNFPHPHSMLDMNVSVDLLRDGCVTRKLALKFGIGAGMSLRGSDALANATQLCHKCTQNWSVCLSVRTMPVATLYIILKQ
jgi:hypothetical protein